MTVRGWSIDTNLFRLLREDVNGRKIRKMNVFIHFVFSSMLRADPIIWCWISVKETAIPHIAEKTETN